MITADWHIHSRHSLNYYPERFKRQYVEYLAGLKAAGVPLCIGSDHHAQHAPYAEAAGRCASPGQDGTDPFAKAERMLAEGGIRDGDLWRLASPGSRNRE